MEEDWSRAISSASLGNMVATSGAVVVGTDRNVSQICMVG